MLFELSVFCSLAILSTALANVEYDSGFIDIATLFLQFFLVSMDYVDVIEDIKMSRTCGYTCHVAFRLGKIASPSINLYSL